MTNSSQREYLLTIIEGAKQFECNFANKNFLLIYKDDKNAYKFVETIAYRGNFLHLTGVDTEMEQTDFFSKALKSELTLEDFSIRSGSDAVKKLSVMKEAMSFNKNAKITGYFNPRFSKKLYTEILVGNKRFALGFVRDTKTNGKYYVPNTLLGGDVKDYVKQAFAIDAIFEKSVNEDLYSNLVHISNKNKVKGILSLPLSKSIKKLIEPYIKLQQPQEKTVQEQQSSARIQNDVINKAQKNDNDKLDLVAATIEQCGQKIDLEIAQSKNTQKEAAPHLQQGQQVGQAQQVQQVGQVRQVGQVKQKTKANSGSSGKR